MERFARDKHYSLFVQIISEEERKFEKNTPRTAFTKPHFLMNRPIKLE
jgi:hypothetical protein